PEPRHLLSFPTRRSSDLSVQHIFLLYERHLAVDLCEFRLSVCTQVFIPEAFHNLKIAIKAAHHQQLFESLWRLWQRIELMCIQPDRKSTRLNSSHVKISY